MTKEPTDPFAGMTQDALHYACDTLLEDAANLRESDHQSDDQIATQFVALAQGLARVALTLPRGEPAYPDSSRPRMLKLAGVDA